MIMSRKFPNDFINLYDIYLNKIGNKYVYLAVSEM